MSGMGDRRAADETVVATRPTSVGVVRGVGDADSVPVIDEQGRPEPPVAAGEVETLVGFLEWQRATLEWKTRGLDAAGLAQRSGPSAMSLGGILKHMAWVEDHWFSHVLHHRPRCEQWCSVDWSAAPDWEWHSAATDPLMR